MLLRASRCGSDSSGWCLRAALPTRPRNAGASDAAARKPRTPARLRITVGIGFGSLGTSRCAESRKGSTGCGGQEGMMAWKGVEVALKLTAVFRKVPEGYIAFVEELPGANTQGKTLEEARSNLLEAVELVLEANRTLAEEEIGQSEVIREPLQLPA